ncbi:hypothetical protein TanjilG_27531 [Lupinus angustifolius]|uniref:DUF7950 domain-containing protein n=1 Tax=Lupinus angustifolius TaxID=3871 RepID=A0A4P1R311_LUPAN|nr:PREDICTED: uncharacterized protein LOC109361759 [Lupinus angustifolius]OIW00280.1 hypothetical protein TanjilG_27531 [Lupinus angustifolius]
MECRGGCCIARYATGGAYDMSKWDKIMLRFRPIAPKPVSGKATTASGGSSSESSNAFSAATRPKRKYVRSVKDNSNSNKRNTRRKSTTLSSEQKQHQVPVVTLPLLPETPDLKDLTLPVTKEVLNNNNKTNKNIPLWLSFENLSHTKVEPYRYYGATSSYSCVTVESVMDTWLEVESIGSTDDERRVNLSKDTCPGFITDGYGKVTWMNGAYREMVGEGACVLLTMKKNVSATVTNPLSFTCRVRVVEYDTCGKERSSFTVPCDVWRMDFGFTWRLDVKTALSLSLGR